MVIDAGAAMDAAIARMAVPWAWGSADCATSACSVFSDLHGFDPMSDLRGRYRTALGALRIANGFGGTRAMWREVLHAQGFEFGQGGRIGDLGLAQGDGRFDAALVICVDHGWWAGKTETGMMVMDKATGFKCPDC